jgi:cell division protease FtsH
MLPKLDPVHKVTIIPRGGALGVTVSLPEKDRYSVDKVQMLNRISMLFGGRIAEEVFMGQMTTGASNDFERATQMARDMVMRYGMSDSMGPMVYAENEGEVFLGRSVTKTTNISEQTMRHVDEEVRRIIDEQYGIARKLIEDNQDKMHAMAKALLEWETIDGDQIEDIMHGRPPRPPKDWSGSLPPPGGGSGTAPAVGGEAAAHTA